MYVGADGMFGQAELDHAGVYAADATEVLARFELGLLDAPADGEFFHLIRVGRGPIDPPAVGKIAGEGIHDFAI